jgi:hypothetical protein
VKDVEHFFMHLLTMYTSFESCLFNFFLHLVIGLFAHLVFNFWSSLYILDINPLSNEYMAKIFFHSVVCFLILILISFSVQKLFNLIQSYLSVLALIS